MPFLDLSLHPEVVRRIVTTLGLADADEPVEPVALAGGVSSGIYRIDLRSGCYCLKQALPQLRVAKEWRVPVERVFAEIDWLRTAGAIVPGHVPVVLGQDEATGSFVMPFLGAGYRLWKADLLAGDVEPAAARAMGTLLGRIHAATADDPALARRFATDANFRALRLEPYLAETARMHPDLAAQLLATAQRTAGTRRVLVHGDVSPKNILLGPDGPVLLDAECAWFGDPAFDVAFCLNHFLLKAAHRPAQSDALLGCLRAFSGAYFPQVAWEPAPALEARVAALLPALTLARIDGKSPVEYLGEPQRAAVRQAAAALVRSAPAGLDPIAARWAQEFAS